MTNLIKHTIILLSISTTFISLAQEIVGGNPSFTPTPYIVEKTDSTTHNIYYKYTFARNPERKTKTKTATTVLQIGTNFSKFVDYNTLKYDSLIKIHSKLDRVKKDEMNAEMAFRKEIGFELAILKNFSNSIFTIYARHVPRNDYEFTIEQPQFQWKLTPEYKNILNYSTQKATVTFGGRNWVAWFAKAIPINLGPYTFGDLPGLILELYDEELNFQFTAIALDNKPSEIYMHNGPEIVKTTKKEYFKIEKSFHDRPDLFFNMEAVRGVPSLPKKPYNPIELDL